MKRTTHLSIHVERKGDWLVCWLLDKGEAEGKAGDKGKAEATEDEATEGEARLTNDIFTFFGQLVSPPSLLRFS